MRSEFLYNDAVDNFGWVGAFVFLRCIIDTGIGSAIVCYYVVFVCFDIPSVRCIIIDLYYQCNYLNKMVIQVLRF